MVLVVPRCLLRPPPRPQVKQEMMMSNRPAIAPMIAWRTEAMPLTIAMRQAPMVRNMLSIHETTAPILKLLRCATDCVFCSSLCLVVGLLKMNRELV